MKEKLKQALTLLQLVNQKPAGTPEEVEKKWEEFKKWFENLKRLGIHQDRTDVVVLTHIRLGNEIIHFVLSSLSLDLEIIVRIVYMHEEQTINLHWHADYHE